MVSAFVSSAFGLRAPVLTRSSICGAQIASARAPVRSSVTMESSPSVPFLPKPENLSEDMPGYFGFDPLGISNLVDVKFLQEAEIKHGRVCMLAVVGLLVSEQVVFPFYKGAPSLASGVHEWGVSSGPMVQLLFWISFFEVVVGTPALVQMMSLNSPRKPGEFAFDPLGMGKNPDTYKKYQLNEIMNGRLAMIAVGGFIHQEWITGMTPIQQLTSGKFLP